MSRESHQVEGSSAGPGAGVGLERVIEAALEPGYFVGYRRSSDFVRALEEVRDRVVELVDAGEATRAVSLFELFIAGCYEKSEEIDDSGGIFGDFVGGLFCDWIRARQVAGSDPEGTAGIFLSWMENDDYGYCYGIEERAAKAFDRPGLEAFEEALRAGWDSEDREDFQRRRMVEILKAIHMEREDPEAYAALCEEEGDLAPKDCEEIARLCLGAGRLEEALGWADRGLELNGTDEGRGRSAWDLPRLRRRILLELGRNDEALTSAWEDYRRVPSRYSYEDLMEFAPAADREKWHRRALDAGEEADLRLRMDLFVETSEVERLARAVEAAPDGELMAVSHDSLEPAAKKLVSSHPLLVVRLRRIMAAQILNAAKSPSYPAALSHLERVREILLENGRTSDWDAVVSDIRSKHGRKSRFMPGFERLVAGKALSGPSFLDRARTRWHKTTGEGDVHS